MNIKILLGFYCAVIIKIIKVNVSFVLLLVGFYFSPVFIFKKKHNTRKKKETRIVVK